MNVDYMNVDSRFSTLLLHHFDTYDNKKLKKQLKEQEDEMCEEDEDTEEENSGAEDVERQVESGEKQLLKTEFFSAGYCSFMRGNDADIDYR